MVPLIPSRASSSVPLTPAAAQAARSGARRAAGSGNGVNR
jgi:hypothetical protein